MVYNAFRLYSKSLSMIIRTSLVCSCHHHCLNISLHSLRCETVCYINMNETYNTLLFALKFRILYWL